MKRMFVATAALALFLTACGTEKAVEPTSEVQAQETNAEDVLDKYIFMYEDAVLHDVAYQIVGVEAAQEMAGYASEGGVYLAVQVQVTNNSKQAINLRNGQFQLFSNEAYYEHDTAVTAYHDKGFTLEKINPGMSKTASVVYEVPQSVLESPCTLKIKPNQVKNDIANIVIAERP